MNPLIVRLARRSLCLSLVLLPSACLSPVPEYEVPEQVAPFFAMDRATPLPIEVLTVEGSVNKLEFSVPFRSLDAGEGLRVIFVQDIDPKSPPNPRKIIGSREVAADDRPISEQGDSRTVVYPWVFEGDRPVYQPEVPTTFTMILAHESNFIGITYGLVDPLESAQATWLIAFRPSGAE